MDCTLKEDIYFGDKKYTIEYSQSDFKIQKYYIDGYEVLKAFIPTMVLEIFYNKVK